MRSPQLLNKPQLTKTQQEKFWRDFAIRFIFESNAIEGSKLSQKEVENKIQEAVTDPARIRIDDPGHPEVCTVFEYHKAFNKEEMEEIEENCRQGKIGCVACKKKLGSALNNLLEPIREKRVKYINNPSLVDEVLLTGTRKARKVARETIREVREAMKLDYFPE